MVIHSRRNLYRGLNAHYQSAVQHELNGWRPFHTVFITTMMWHIQERLPTGYRIEPEDSLQITVSDDDGQQQRFPIADAAIWESESAHTPIATPTPTIAPIKSQATADTLEEATDWNALVIREERADGQFFPVTRIEVFSPANKLGHGRQTYLKGRAITLRAGTSLVEIDFLHETDSPIKGVPSYASRDAHAYPFTITLNNAHTHQSDTYGFRVDEPLAALPMPLLGEAAVSVEFGIPYDQAYQNTFAFSDRVDYAREPIAIDRYLPTDQNRIWARMLGIIQTVRAGSKPDDNRPMPDHPCLQWLADTVYDRANILVGDQQVNWLIRHDDALTLLDEAAQPKRVRTGTSRALQERYDQLLAVYQADGLDALLAQT